MRDPGLPSLDQLRVFIAVIDHGGFAHAARELHRTQSVISYTIANLEEQLNVELLDRSKRKPVLTEAGKALLADARAVSLKVDSMRSRAKALSSGLEAEVSLVVDVMYSTCKLVRILHAFQREFPTVSMRLRMEALGAVTQLVLDGTCQVGVSGWMPGTPDTIERQACGFVTMVPVVSPMHPLAQIKGKVPTAILREHTQLVVTDRSEFTKGQDFGVMALRDWRLGDLGAKHALLRSGIGWGNMPVELIQYDLDAGRLVQIELNEGNSFSFPLYVIHRGDSEPGPAGQWLMQQFLDLHEAGQRDGVPGHTGPPDGIQVDGKDCGQDDGQSCGSGRAPDYLPEPPARKARGKKAPATAATAPAGPMPVSATSSSSPMAVAPISVRRR